jgi:hypothetical protein
MGMYALQIADKALRDAKVIPDPVLPAKTLADIPVIKAFVVRYPSATAQSIQDFYDDYYASKKYYDTTMALAKQGDTKALALMQAHQSDMVQLDGIQETLTSMSQYVRMVHKNPNFSSTDKRQLIDTAYYRMIEISKAGNAMLGTIKETMKP